MPHFDAYTPKQRELLNQLHRECVYDASRGRGGNIPPLPDGIDVDMLSMRYASLVHDRLTSAMEWLPDFALTEARFIIVRCELGYYICLYEFHRMDENFSLYFDGRREGIASSRGMIGCRVKYQAPWNGMGSIPWIPVDIDY